MRPCQDNINAVLLYLHHNDFISPLILQKKTYDPYDHVTFISVLKFLLEVTPPDHGCILRYPGEGSLVVVPLHVKAIVLKPPVVGVPDVPVAKWFIIDT